MALMESEARVEQWRKEARRQALSKLVQRREGGRLSRSVGRWKLKSTVSTAVGSAMKSAESMLEEEKERTKREREQGVSAKQEN